MKIFAMSSLHFNHAMLFEQYCRADPDTKVDIEIVDFELTAR